MLHIKIIDLPRDKMVSIEDLQKIRGGRYSLDFYDQIVDQAKSGAENAKEQWKMALRILRDVEKRRSDLVSRMTRI